MENCLDEVSERNGLYIFYTGNHNPGELRKDLWKMWWWDDINLVSQKSADSTSNLFAFHYFPFPTDIYFKKKLILYKISFKRKKSKTAET